MKRLGPLNASTLACTWRPLTLLPLLLICQHLALQCFSLLYHSSILEPQRLIMSSRNAGSIHLSDELIVFQREAFFAVGALGSIGFSGASIVQALIHKFRSTPGYGMRSVFDLFDFDCLKRADCPKSKNRLVVESWQSAIEEPFWRLIQVDAAEIRAVAAESGIPQSLRSWRISSACPLYA